MTEVADLVMETTATMGVGSITLLGAVAGFFSFAESFADGDEVFYCQRQKGGAREVCKGTFTAPATLSRGVPLRSSAPGNAPVDWADGTRVVYSCLPASQVLLAENALSEIEDFLIAGNHFSEIAALGSTAQDASLGNLGATAVGLALVKAASAAAGRTALLLGSAAVLNAGTAAGNAVQLDGGGALPAVPGAALTSLPAHSHANVIAPYTGGASSRICRYASTGVVTEADKDDAPGLLCHLFARGSDGLLYGAGSTRVPFGGIVAGQKYYLGDGGVPSTTLPIPDTFPLGNIVDLGVAMETGFLYFDPKPPVGLATGAAVAVRLEGGTLRVG